MQEKGAAKLKKVQDRAEADRKAKAEKSAEWLKQQQERMQQKVKVAALRLLILRCIIRRWKLLNAWLIPTADRAAEG